MKAKKVSKKKPAFNVDRFLATADGGRGLLTFRKNKKVFSQGDPANAVFYIRDGVVKVSVISELGKEAVVALHEKGDFFGEGCLLGQLLRLRGQYDLAQPVPDHLAQLVRKIEQPEACSRHNLKAARSARAGERR